jgi:small subunit ribosomal protein S2
MPYVNERWLGGMLTNFTTISARVKKMMEYERMKEAGDFEAMPKKEALILSRELEKLQRNLGGIRGLNRMPDAVFIIDTKKEHIAVTEANKLNMPIVAVVDTNCDPDLIQYVIPGNDDAIRAGTLMCRVISDAVEEGKFIASRKNANRAAAAAATRPAATAPAAVDPEAEARRTQQQAEARRQAALQAQEREARIAASRRDTDGGEAPAPAPTGEAPVPAAPAAEDTPAPAAGVPAEALPAGAAAPADAPTEDAAPAAPPVEASTDAAGSNDATSTVPGDA